MRRKMFIQSTAPFVFPAANPSSFRVALTIAAGKVASDLTNFPVYVDLSGMPTGFWNHVKPDGGDIRVRTTTGTLIPFDLARFDYYDHTGALFIRRTVTTASDTVVYIHYGNPGLSLLAPGDANGRNAVWADYTSVFLLGETADDRTGGAAPAVVGDPEFFEIVETSPDINSHQGICSDGTFYYITDTNRIDKYDLSWNLVASNADPIASTGLPVVNHCGDLDVYNGKLYIPIEFFADPAHSDEHICVFNASDLSFDQAFDISAQADEISSIAYCDADGLLYITCFSDGTFLNKYNPTSGVFQGALTLTASDASSLAGLQWQGITYWHGAFWLSSELNDETYRCTYSGTVQVSGLFGRPAATAYEGIGHIKDALIQLVDDAANENVFRLKPYSITNGVNGGVSIDTTGEYVSAAGRTSLTTFTMGVTATFSDKSQNRVPFSYWDNGVNDVRATLAYRQSSGVIGFWDNVNTWTLSVINPTLNQSYRINGVVNGTTYKRVFVDGVQSGNTNTPLAVSNALDTILIGREDSSDLESHRGLIGFVYLRPSALSNDWIAAEYSNINAPASFYSLGPEVAI